MGRWENAQYTVVQHARLIDNENDSEEAHISDLLADLMHLCGHMNYDFQALLATAEMNYESERS